MNKKYGKFKVFPDFKVWEVCWGQEGLEVF